LSYLLLGGDIAVISHWHCVHISVNVCSRTRA